MRRPTGQPDPAVAVGARFVGCGREPLDFPAVEIVDGTPVRTCIGCRERAAKRELLRVVLGQDRDGRPVVAPDPRSRAAGRGAHVHPTLACLELAMKRRAFARALRFDPQSHGGAALDMAGLKQHLEEMTASNDR